EPVEWLLRLAELRLLAARWQIADVHLEGHIPGAKKTDSTVSTDATDVVLVYRNAKKIKQLAERSGGRLRVVDADSAYFRLKPRELPPPVLYQTLKQLLRFP